MSPLAGGQKFSQTYWRKPCIEKYAKRIHQQNLHSKKFAKIPREGATSLTFLLPDLRENERGSACMEKEEKQAIGNTRICHQNATTNSCIFFFLNLCFFRIRHTQHSYGKGGFLSTSNIDIGRQQYTAFRPGFDYTYINNSEKLFIAL